MKDGSKECAQCGHDISFHIARVGRVVRMLDCKACCCKGFKEAIPEYMYSQADGYSGTE
jgi:hypothetical protein